ncbi:MAG: SIMPL domain-containing protein [Rhodocyclales bacterium]|nr:SIMPL domain-containing protein [Rhodocyclales bacterium]
MPHLHRRHAWHRAIAPLLFLVGTQAALAATTIDLAAEASRPAANDLARATVFAEATSPSAGESAKRVNALIADALAATKGHPRVKAKTAGTQTYPVYSKGGGRIEAWRMRSEIALESGDTTALSELLGKLQTTLGVSGINLAPSPETRKKVENEALLDAIAAFRERAKLAADALGKPYRIKHLTLGSQSYRPPVPMMRAAPMAAMEAMPMPVEAGESQVTVTVSGQIELSD